MIDKSTLCSVCSELGDGLGVVGLCEDARTRDEDIGAGLGCASDRIVFNTAVDFDREVGESLADGGDLLRTAIDIRLTAKPWIDSHDEDEIEAIGDVIEAIDGRMRIECRAGAATKIADIV